MTNKYNTFFQCEIRGTEAFKKSLFKKINCFSYVQSQMKNADSNEKIL